MKVPLYQQLATTLRNRIASGEFKVNAQLPKEVDLCAQYQLSRHTVRAALRVLADEDSITRKKRAGTHVNGSAGRAAFQQRLANLDDLVLLAETAEREVLDARTHVMSKRQQANWGLPTGSKWLHLSTRRIERESPLNPICVSEVYIDAGYAPLVATFRQEKTTLISDIIENATGRRVAHVEQTITATVLTPRDARMLNTEPETAALCIERRYFDAAGICFEVVESVHPAHRFQLKMRLERAI